MGAKIHKLTGRYTESLIRAGKVRKAKPIQKRD